MTKKPIIMIESDLYFDSRYLFDRLSDDLGMLKIIVGKGLLYIENQKKFLDRDSRTVSLGHYIFNNSFKLRKGLVKYLDESYDTTRILCLSKTKQKGIKHNVVYKKKNIKDTIFKFYEIVLHKWECINCCGEGEIEYFDQCGCVEQTYSCNACQGTGILKTYKINPPPCRTCKHRGESPISGPNCEGCVDYSNHEEVKDV